MSSLKYNGGRHLASTTKFWRKFAHQLQTLFVEPFVMWRNGYHDASGVCAVAGYSVSVLTVAR